MIRSAEYEILVVLLLLAFSEAAVGKDEVEEETVGVLATEGAAAAVAASPSRAGVESAMEGFVTLGDLGIAVLAEFSK